MYVCTYICMVFIYFESKQIFCYCYFGGTLLFVHLVNPFFEPLAIRPTTHLRHFRVMALGLTLVELWY